MADAHDRDGVIANINTLVDRPATRTCRSSGCSTPTTACPRAPTAGSTSTSCSGPTSEPLVHKHYGDSFEETELEELLAERKVGRLVVTGAQTDACIRSTLHGALVRGYDATLVADAHTTEDPSAWGAPLDAGAGDRPHQPLLELSPTAPGRKGGTVPTAEVDFTSAG